MRRSKAIGSTSRGHGAKRQRPVTGLFSDEDREIAARSLGVQRGELERRREAGEAAEVERDREIVAAVAARRRAEGKPWTAETEARMLAERVARRRGAD
jgi:hypothetical protein